MISNENFLQKCLNKKGYKTRILTVFFSGLIGRWRNLDPTDKLTSPATGTGQLNRFSALLLASKSKLCSDFAAIVFILFYFVVVYLGILCMYFQDSIELLNLC